MIHVPVTVQFWKESHTKLLTRKVAKIESTMSEYPTLHLQLQTVPGDCM